MIDHLERAAELLKLYDAEIRQLLPEDAELFDAHVHCGTDIDGFKSPVEDLVSFLRHSGAQRAFCFCLDEPDRHPAFRAANDRTLAAAADSDGLLVPFVRLDLAEHPVDEAERCLDRGARGVKLHPRAQSFLLNDERLEPIFALAEERGVPILIHGGRGLPPIADDLARLVERHPASRLIVAHAGIADLGTLADHFAGHPGVFFDTSVWAAVDLLDLFGRVSPEQVVYASDYPYGIQPQALLLDLRVARLAGYTEEQVRGLLGCNAAKVADGEPLPSLTPAPPATRTFSQPIQLARIHTYLAMTTPLLWSGAPDAMAPLGLALNAAGERDGEEEVCDRIVELLACARDLWRMLPELEDDEELRYVASRARQLVHLADIEATTSPAAIPSPSQ